MTKRYCVAVHRTEENEHRAASLDAVLEMYEEEREWDGVEWIIEEDDEVWNRDVDVQHEGSPAALLLAIYTLMWLLTEEGT